MTWRARWLIGVALVGLVLSAFRGQSLTVLLVLSVLIWITVEWCRFQLRVYREFPRYRFERLVNGQSQPASHLWAGRNVHITLRVRCQQPITPTMTIFDWVPEILEPVEAIDAEVESGEVIIATIAPSPRPLESFLHKLARWFNAFVANSKEASKNPHQWQLTSRCKEGQFVYRGRLRAAGRLCLPGLRVVLSDPYGFFQHHAFVPLEMSFRVLPPFFDSGEMAPVIKRSNSLPQHGVHRLQRSGMGSELLELREYVDGDPPKSIAWKVSARRDRLMTRQYESEVPVRLQLFLDGSMHARIGGYGQRLLDQLNYVAASVAKAAISVGDPVGAYLVDERGTRHLSSVSGEKGFHQLLKEIADFTELPQLQLQALTSTHLERAHRLFKERYPELLDRSYNSVPFAFRRSSRLRYELAAGLATVLNLQPLEQMESMFDDLKLANHIQSFVTRMGMAWMEPISSQASDNERGKKQIQQLSESIVRAVLHARDNEVFVVLADLMECAPHVDALLPAFRLALARHHRIVVVCPTSTFLRPGSGSLEWKSDRLQDLLFAAEQGRLQEMAEDWKKAMVKHGIAMTFSGEQSAIRLILSEMRLAREGRKRIQGVMG